MLRGFDQYDARFAFYWPEQMTERLFAQYVKQTPADDIGTADRLTRLAVISDELDGLERFDEACTASRLPRASKSCAGHRPQHPRHWVIRKQGVSLRSDKPRNAPGTSPFGSGALDDRADHESSVRH
jgi:hypothetical protein